MAISSSSAVARALDRDSLIAWFEKNRERSPGCSTCSIPTRTTRGRSRSAIRSCSTKDTCRRSASSRCEARPRPARRRRAARALFERGIDPDSDDAACRAAARRPWPSRDEVLAFGARRRRADDRRRSRRRAFDRPGHPRAHRAEARLHRARARGDAPGDAALHVASPAARRRSRRQPAALARRLDRRDRAARAARRARSRRARDARRRDPRTLPFGWDNEFDAQSVDVPALRDRRPQRHQRRLPEFVDAGGYDAAELWTEAGWEWRAARAASRIRASGNARRRRWYWRGMFEDIPLPLAWPVYVSQAEASAYARMARRRLPTEAEYHRAAFGTPHRRRPRPERQYPVGRRAARRDARQLRLRTLGTGAGRLASARGERVGRARSGRQRLGMDVDGLRAVPGLQRRWPSYPEYSADFFDGQHYVMKGASPATASELVRRSFRNWFRPNYPYVYATFRCVRDPR